MTLSLRWMLLVPILAFAACGDDSSHDDHDHEHGPGGHSHGPDKGTDGDPGHDSDTDGDATPGDGANGPIVFRDIRQRSGITWKHEFIDHETGTTYKVNPYDHGSGILVADVNGDDRDDVLFLDFLGDNALYTSNGDGTFEDATAKSGLALPRSITVGGCFGGLRQRRRPGRVPDDVHERQPPVPEHR